MFICSRMNFEEINIKVCFFVIRRGVLVFLTVFFTASTICSNGVWTWKRKWVKLRCELIVGEREIIWIYAAFSEWVFDTEKFLREWFKSDTSFSRFFLLIWLDYVACNFIFVKVFDRCCLICNPLRLILQCF